METKFIIFALLYAIATFALLFGEFDIWLRNHLEKPRSGKWQLCMLLLAIPLTIITAFVCSGYFVSDILQDIRILLMMMWLCLTLLTVVNAIDYETRK